MDRSRTGVLVLRAWSEPDASEPLRVVIRWRPDIGAEMEHRLTTADAVEVHRVVDAFIESVLDVGSG